MAEMRRCIGSERFGIESHEAPIEDFPKQPSQRDGLGRMCREHWNLYTRGLARDAVARKAAASGEEGVTAVVTDESQAGTKGAGVTGPVITEPPETPKRQRRAKAASASTDGEEAAG
jgi:hypothetical protein